MTRWAEVWHPSWVRALVEMLEGELLQRRRAWVLSGLTNPEPGLSLNVTLLESGQIAQAQALAADYLAGPPKLRRLAQRILGDIAVERVAFKKAQESWKRYIDARPVAEWDGSEPINRYLRLADVLGTSQVVADELTDKYLLPEAPLAYDPAQPWSWTSLLATCRRAGPERAKRCMQLFDQHRRVENFGGTITAAYEDYVVGIRSYLRGDLRGAAAAWRKLDPADRYFPLLVDVSVFDAIGEGAEASAIDTKLFESATTQFVGVSPPFLREAKRAAARGDKARARELAAKVIAAWGKADTAIPGLDEMRELL